MFGRQPVFSALVAQFDVSLNSLTWNDGKLIQHLTGQAKMAKPQDAGIIVACINFRIIRNPHGAKIPVIYLMDSITKNSGAIYATTFSATVSKLIPAVYEVMTDEKEKSSLVKLVDAWVGREAFAPPLLAAIRSAFKQSDARRAIKPTPTGWPANTPNKELLHAELEIAKYFWVNLFPGSAPTTDELNFAKDSLIELARLLGPLDEQLGRVPDPEFEKLIQQYEAIARMKPMLNSPHATQSPPPIFTPPPSAMSSDPRLNELLDLLPPPLPSGSSPAPPHITHLPLPSFSLPPSHSPVAPVSSNGAPSISDPRNLSKYYQANINMLYKNLPHRCTTCGMRFKTNDELSAHLNWHYYDRTLIGRQGAHSQKLQRQWYLSAQEWVDTCGGTRGQSIEEKANGGSSALASDDRAAADNTPKIVRITDSEHDQQANCFACGDEIDQPEYDETGWYYPNTIRGINGELYHAKCAASMPSLNNSLNLNNSTQLNASLDMPTPTKKRAHQDSDDSSLEALVNPPELKKPKVEE